jgi:FMN phosphatase YigB (HAD superfamily)
MKIGIDFDNTIVCYDQVFYEVAKEQKLIEDQVSISKGHVRDYLRAIGQEEAWTELQGLVYGKYIKLAPAYPGALEFLKECNKAGIEVNIISHKTRFPFLGEKHDLHQAASDWLEMKGFYNMEQTGLSKDKVFFELTKVDKLRRITLAGCNMFIDDLPEFLAESGFPKNIKKVLFDPNNRYPDNFDYLRLTSWNNGLKII